MSPSGEENQRLCHEQNNGYWRPNQKILYFRYVRDHLLLLKSATKMKQRKAFSMLSEIIETRNALQIRSHHQKMIRKFKSVQNLAHFSKQYLSDLRRTSNREGQASQTSKSQPSDQANSGILRQKVLNGTSQNQQVETRTSDPKEKRLLEIDGLEDTLQVFRLSLDHQQDEELCFVQDDMLKENDIFEELVNHQKQDEI